MLMEVTMGLMNEYINKRMDAAALEKELLTLIKKYNDHRKTYLIVYAAASMKDIPDVTLNMDDYYIMYDLLKDVTSKDLDIYIETPGGSGETAEEIVRYTRTKFDNVNFVVSGEAKSAGTIMVLSADNILMTGSGSLGPIDAQVPIGRTRISAYDYMEWVNETRSNADKDKKLNPFDAVMVAQISPGEIKHVYNSLKFAEDLVKDWLPKYKFKNWNVTRTRKLPVTPEMKTKRATEIAEMLTMHSKWRSHGRSIKIKELQEEIGLEIEKVDDDPVLSDIVYRIQTVIRMLFLSTTSYKIFATHNQKIFKQAIPVGNIGPQMPMVPQLNAAELNIKCQQCGKDYHLYAKLLPDPQIDKDLTAKGFMKFPKDSKIKCTCGFEINLIGIKNDIETKTGRKIIL